MKCDAMQRMKKNEIKKHGGLMRTRRRFREAGNETETNQRSKAFDHNDTQDREKNVEPAAESRRGCEAERGSVKSAVAGQYGSRR